VKRYLHPTIDPEKEGISTAIINGLKHETFGPKGHKERKHRISSRRQPNSKSKTDYEKSIPKCVDLTYFSLHQQLLQSTHGIVPEKGRSYSLPFLESLIPMHDDP
jgi:hypothetical protein